MYKLCYKLAFIDIVINMIYKHLNHNNSPIITANNRLKGQQYYISSSKKTLSICQKSVKSILTANREY